MVHYNSSSYQKDNDRVATQSWRPEKVTEFDIWLKNHWIWENLRLETIIMPTLKPNFWVSCDIEHIKLSTFSLFVTKSQILVNVICSWNILAFSSNTVFIVPPCVEYLYGVKQKNFLKWSRKSQGIFFSCLSNNPVLRNYTWIKLDVSFF